MFEVRTRRRTFQLLLEGIPAGELALDWTTIPVDGGEPARLRRIEVELLGEPDPALEAFVRAMREECGLQPAGVSKYEGGLLATGIRPPELIDLGPTDVDASKSLGEVAAAVLRVHLAAFLDHEPGTRLGDDSEDLHDMRVASRRLRAAMSLFADVLPVRTARLREEVGWAAEALGAVRDLDVQLEQSAEWEARASEAERPSLKALAALLEDQRREARSRLLEALDSRRYQRLSTGMIDLARSAPLRRSVRSRTPVLAAAPDLIRERYRKVRKAGDPLGRDSAPAEYHRLRIRCKRLRYALEFLSKVYPEHTAALIRRLVVLQDLLGLHQDAQVAVARLYELVERHGSSLPPETIFAMGRIAERHERQAEELRQRFPKAYRKVRGSPWSVLRRAMKLGRQSTEATSRTAAMRAEAPTPQPATDAPA
jgi:CHAD domain-containing protein